MKNQINSLSGESFVDIVDNVNKSHQKAVKLTNCLYNLIINFLRNRQTGSASCTDILCTPGESDFVMKGLGIPNVYIDLSFTQII